MALRRFHPETPCRDVPTQTAQARGHAFCFSIKPSGPHTAASLRREPSPKLSEIKSANRELATLGS